MRGSFGSTDWRVSMTVLLIILFFAVPLFLVAYQLGVYVRDHHYVPRNTEDALREERNRAETKREVQWGPQIAAKTSSTPLTKINGG